MKVLSTMRDALADDQLLGHALPGASWESWRVLLIAAAGEKLTKFERKTFAQLTGRDREPRAMCEVLLAIAGRRSGVESGGGICHLDFHLRGLD